MFFYICNIGKTCKYIDIENCKTLVSALITSHLHYCNALYYDLPDSALYRLQKVKNSLARVLSCAHKFFHITSIIKLHCLPKRFRLIFKILLHVFKVFNRVFCIGTWSLYLLMLTYFFSFVPFPNFMIIDLAFVVL